MRFFKGNNFCLKIRFSQAQLAISDCRFFLKTGVFSMRLLFNSFSSKPFYKKRNVLRASGTPRRFRHYATCRRQFINFFSKFWKFFNVKFFFDGFPLTRMGFLLCPVGEEWFSRLMRIHSGIFWGSKIDEILTMSFYP